MKLNSSLIFLVLFPLYIVSSSSIEFDQDYKPVPPPKTPCDIFFQYIYNSITNQTTDVPQSVIDDATIFMQYSGHSMNDLGMWNTCRSTSHRNYYLMEINSSTVNTAGGTLGIYLGLCLPDYCSQDYLTSKTANLLQILHAFNIKDLKNLDVVYIDPMSYKIEKGFWLYFTIVLFTIIALLNIFGTCLSQFVKSDPKSVKSITTNRSSLKDMESNNLADSLLSSNDQPVAPRKPSISDSIGESLKARPKLLKFLQCFDFNKNITQLFNAEKDARMDTSLNLLDGLRSIAFIGIIYAHTFLNSAVSKNELALYQFAHSPGFLYALIAFFGVDVFFILSGFLQGFQLTGKLKRMPFHPKTYFDLIRHRWIRLVPAYFVGILFYWKIGVLLGNGPLWYQYVERAQQCGSFWKNLIFLDNVLNTTARAYCFNWGWYLACDFQMFLMAPFLCWIYLKNKTRFHNVLWFVGLITFIGGFMSAVNSSFMYAIPPPPSNGTFYSDFYSNPIVRMSTYLVGILLGTQYRAYKQGETDNLFAVVKKNKKLAYTLSVSGVLTVLFIIYFPRTIQTGSLAWPDGFNYFWQVVDRPLLALGVFMAVMPGIVGLLRPVSWFLGSYWFNLISKLSYSGYLIQMIVIWICFKIETVYLGFSDSDKSNLTIAIVVVSLTFAVVLYLLVEKPAVNLEASFMSHAPAQNNQKKVPATGKPEVPEYKITGRKKLDE